jgi:hypothetical protein
MLSKIAMINNLITLIEKENMQKEMCDVSKEGNYKKE